MAVKNKIQISGDVVVDYDEYLITAKPNGLIKLSLEGIDTEKEKSKTIKWISHWFHNTPDVIKEDAQYYKKNELNLRVEEVYSGGGLGWLEPFEENSTPRCQTPYGYFFNCIGKRSIDKIEWREYQMDNNGPLINLNKGKHYGQGVQLHVYTTGMYGQELQVFLKDVRKTDQDLNLDENFKDKKNTLKNYLGAEVDVYADEQGNKIQKAIITINIEHRWRVLASGWFSGYGLDIVPIIRTTLKDVDHGDFTAKKYQLPIEVSKGKKIEAPEVVKSGNNPVIIEKIETNPAEFHPCRYEKVSVLFEEDNEEKTLVLYDSKDQGRKDELEYPIVVGTDQKRRRFKIQLEGVKTDDCRFLGKSNQHKNKVINISSLQNKIKQGHGKRSNQWRGGNTEDIAKDAGLPTGEVQGKNKNGEQVTIINGEIKSEKSGDQNDDRAIDASHMTNKLSIVSKIIDINIKKSFNILEKHRPFILEQPTDELLELELGYDFSFGGRKHHIMGLLNSIIPNREAAIQRYSLILETCARTHPIDILVIPDTKCTIQLAFNVDIKQFNRVREAYHQKWKRKELKAEGVIKRLEEKRDKSQSEHMDVYMKAQNLEEEGKGKSANRKYKEERSIWREKVEAKNKKIEKANKKLRKAKSKTSKLGQLSKAVDLLEMDDPKGNKILDAEFTGIIEFDRPYGAIEVTPHFGEIVNFLRKIADIKDLVKGIINGKNSSTTKKSPRKNKKRTKKLKKLLDKKKALGAKKSNWSFEYLDPSIALSFSWHAERPKDIAKPIMGTMFTGVIDMNPLFGFEIKYDVYQLLYKIKHPVVFAIVAVLDALDEIAGDQFDIDLDLFITSEISGTMMGMVNTVPGSKYIDRLKEDEDDTPAKLGGKVMISLKGKIQVNGEFESFFFGKYNAYGQVEVVVETGLSMEFVTKANDKMLYVEPEMKFEGLILKGTVNAGVSKPSQKEKAKSRKELDKDIKKLKKEIKNPSSIEPESDPDPIEDLKKENGIHYENEGEIIVLDPYEWEATKWQIPIYRFK